jgi:hypothetical protein
MQNFGTTLRETTSAFRGHFGQRSEIEKMNAIARIVVSGIALIAGLFFAVSHDTTLNKTGLTLVGAVVGYWLR